MAPDSAAAVGRRGRLPRPGPGRVLLVPVLVVLAVVAGVAATGWVTHDRQARDLRREAAEGLTGVRLLQSEQISRWYADQEADARLLASDAALGGLLRRQIRADADGPPSTAVTDMLGVFRRSNDVGSITVLDSSLEVVVTTPSRAAAPDASARALAADALRSGRTVFSDVYRTAQGALALSLATPLPGAGGEGSPPLGVVIQTMDPADTLLPMLEKWPLASASGESILLSERDGRAVYVNELRLRPGGPMSLSVSLGETTLVGVKVVRGARGVHKGLDYRGVPVLASIGRVAGTPWHLVVKQDLATIEKPVRAQAVTTAAWALSIIVIAGLVLFVYWRGREAASLRALVAAEKEQRLAEARYATLMREAGESVVLLSADGTIVEANDHALSAYGYSRGEFVGRDGGLYRVTAGGVFWDERLRRLEEKGGRLAFEGVHRRSDGVEFPVDVGLSAVDVEGEVHYLEIARDIGERKAADAALRAASQRLEATVMSAPIAVVALDRDQVVTLWNPAAAAIFGWSAGEAVGRRVPFISADASGQAGDLLRRVVAGEQLAGVDLPCVRKDGSRMATSASMAALRGAGGDTDGVLVLVEDVGERRANALRLARLTHLYRVLSSVAEMIPRVRDPQRLYEELCRTVVEEGGFMMAWVGTAGDDGAVRLLASAGADAGFAEALRLDVGRPLTCLETMTVALRDGLTDTCSDVFSEERMAEFADEARSRGFRACVAVPIGDGGRPYAALAIYSSDAGAFDPEEVGLLERLAADVAFALEAASREEARRLAERELAELNADLERRVQGRTIELEAANAELEAFSYSVSHDLRAPLRALDGFSLALAEDYGSKLDGEAFDYLRRIRGASQSMARLIDDLLMLSRVTRRELRRETVDLSAAARRIVAELRAAEPEREVETAIEDGLTASGDAHLLQIVLQNLLANAWKFTSRKAGGLIEFRATKRTDGPVFLVKDDGAGFDGAYSDKLFAPFQRLHGDDEFPGTGVGLATVQRIVRRHGGRVWAEGETGKGATVYFTLGPREEGG